MAFALCSGLAQAECLDGLKGKWTTKDAKDVIRPSHTVDPLSDFAFEITQNGEFYRLSTCGGHDGKVEIWCRTGNILVEGNRLYATTDDPHKKSLIGTCEKGMATFRFNNYGWRGAPAFSALTWKIRFSDHGMKFFYRLAPGNDESAAIDLIANLNR